MAVYRDVLRGVLVLALAGNAALAAQTLQVPDWEPLANPAGAVPVPEPAPPPASPTPPGDMLIQLGILPPAPPAEPRRIPLQGGWSDGLKFTSDSGDFRIHVGGSAQIDSTWPIAPHSAFALPNNGGTSGIGGAAATFLRRARLRVDGGIFDQFDFVVEYDFANANNENNGEQPSSFGNITGAPAPANIWLQVRDVPYLGNVRFGNLVKPIGLSQNTSQTNLPFMERPDVADAFTGPFDGGFALGIAARNHTDDDRITWQFGLYRPAVNVFGVAVNKTEWGGRVTALPVDDAENERLIHLGFGTLDGELVQNQLRVRARPLLRNGPGYANPILVDTGEINGGRQYTVAPEFAAVAGSWTFQAEWTGQLFTNAVPTGAANQGTTLYHGGYAEALYFLTGESQPYDRANGAFGRVIPKRDVRTKRGEGFTGWGAWQVGARFSYLDLNDRAIQGGTIYDGTVGLNWYWNPNMKVQFNGIFERRDQPGVPPVWINGVGIRGAYDF